MPAKVGVERIDELMDQASAQLVETNYIRAEKLANEALLLARQANDFERMARIIMPLQEARRQRALQAYATKKVTIITEQQEDPPLKMKPGCYLFQPPLVGADARKFRMAAYEAEVATVVLTREPVTQLRLQPIVAISPGQTLRTKVDLPANREKPELEWFIRAIEELGDWAIDSLDPGIELTRRIDALIARLETVPEHEGLHQALLAACEERAEDVAPNKNGGPPRPRAKAEL